VAYRVSLTAEGESIRQRLDVCPREVVAFERQGLLAMARVFGGALVAKEVELGCSAKALQLTRDFLDCRECQGSPKLTAQSSAKLTAYLA
jgi:hypothetical protein